MAILEKVKQHPYISVAVVFVIIAAVILIGGSGSSQTVSSPAVDPSAVASANAVQVANAQANLQMAGLNASLQASQDNNATQISLAKLKLDSENYLGNLNASIASQQINASQEHSDLVSNLGAVVSEKQIDSTNTLAALQSSTSLQTTKYLTDAVLGQAYYNGQTQQNISSTNASTVIQLAQLNAGTTAKQIQAQKDVSTQSWVSKIFG